jgi:penicillin-binding protein 1A
VVWIEKAPARVRKFSDWSYDEKYNAHWLGERDNGKVPADEVRLAQTPRVQAAIYTMDLESGYVVAMVGGQDYARSEFNRAVQACRQPGSTYKPIYYSAALDEGYSYDTMLNDIPKAEVDPITGEVWIPVNLHGTMDFSVSLEYALVFSKNVPSVDIFSKVGAKKVERWARDLGFTSPIIADKALALGASCVYVSELSRAFAIFARNGRWVEPVYVRRVLDRDGAILEDHTVAWDPMLTPAERLDRLAVTAGVPARQAIAARTAFLTSKLLRSVVTDGYSGSLRQIDIPAAGKTGTSSATMDLWFSAFTSNWLTTYWIGDDLRERPLGKDDAAYMMAVPTWARYVAEAEAGWPHREVPVAVPAGVSPNDRGGNKGKTAEAPMPLAPHKKVRQEQLPTGVQL